jgi:hypothetical protein
MREQATYYGTILDTKTRIITLNSHKSLYRVSRALQGKITDKMFIVCGIWWTVETPYEIMKLVYILTRNRILFPNIEVSFLCNTEKELKILRLLGISAAYCNSNSFVDEKVFYIEPDNKKQYNAVYNAVLSRFKRHFLCRLVENVVFVTYNFQNTAYKQNLDKILSNPQWANYKFGNDPRFLNNEQLRIIYNHAKVGLALSSVEGAMYSSTEYLLCGLPVVSTKSKGGRDIFYNSDNSIICNADEKSVNNAVAKLIRISPDPALIREGVVKIMQEHRARFFKHINSIIRENGHCHKIEDTWHIWYVNKLRNDISADSIFQAFK